VYAIVGGNEMWPCVNCVSMRASAELSLGLVQRLLALRKTHAKWTNATVKMMN